MSQFQINFVCNFNFETLRNQGLHMDFILDTVSNNGILSQSEKICATFGLFKYHILRKQKSKK